MVVSCSTCFSNRRYSLICCIVSPLKYIYMSHFITAHEWPATGWRRLIGSLIFIGHFRKSDLYLVALLWKMICNLGDSMSLRHPVSYMVVSCSTCVSNRRYSFIHFVLSQFVFFHFITTREWPATIGSCFAMHVLQIAGTHQVEYVNHSNLHLTSFLHQKLRFSFYF